MNILCILRVQQHSFSLSSCGCLSYSQSPLIKTLREPEKVSVGVHIKRGEFRENAGADPGFFSGGGALVSCSTSTTINHIVFFFAEYQLY